MNLKAYVISSIARNSSVSYVTTLNTLNPVRIVVACLGGLFFIYVGILHFVDTEWFEPIVPPWLSFPTFWVILSGIFEIGVGFGLLISKTRRSAALASALLLIAVYPANIYMWIYNVELGDGTTLTQIGHIYRLCAQIAGVLSCIWIYKTTPKSVILQSERK